MKAKTQKTTYVKPALIRLDNVKDITFECPSFTCSIYVPPSPSA
ncbi:MAG: hypothetical protein ACYC5F_05380 [Thermoleophilia bacterium]